ncbi:MAG TPA: bifunctional DNA-formamidopyrimidine glycosylase/DNA-(apurinic or apyrimidinic site) lyase [Gammaproteobacteria bacterium]|nr:bifunctional DNA-formamidopyrimidine glycosylase/DNA-(apurinic or apyrimidinic site) lyase [Gammaproteobacteria bacterium]
MPELPEVETTRRGILAQARGRVITAVMVRNRNLRWPVPSRLAAHLSNTRILDIRRRGKYLIFETANGYMLLHLGMSGSLRIETADRAPKKHDHVEWALDDGRLLRLHDPRRFGSVHWIEESPEQHPLLRDLGPEPLGAGFDDGYLFRQSRRYRCSIKHFIMNSKVVVGVGNIYANEALFLAGIAPGRAANRVSAAQYEKLTGAIKTLLQDAIRQGGTTLRDFVNPEGNPGYFRLQLQVYEQTGKPCRRCGKPIRHRVMGQRSSYYCSGCQK